ncbi:MAG: peptide-methionine (S)-S-oxide reductase MsrA [Pseudomonadota bacterium]
MYQAMMQRLILAFVILAAAITAASFNFAHHARADEPSSVDEEATIPAADVKTAVFAGGCFWCIEADFEKLAGVVDVVSGYTGGFVDDPTYEEVSRNRTGHYEAVKVTFDPKKVSYRALVDYFLRHVDPLDPDGQFCDRGSSYRTAIFVETADEFEIATDSKMQAAEQLNAEIVTPILDAATFWPAEDYHQDYYKKNKLKYRYYRTGCGRDRRVRALWG